MGARFQQSTSKLKVVTVMRNEQGKCFRVILLFLSWHTFLNLFQLPCRTGPQTTHARYNVEQNKDCLIYISHYRFSLVISGLTKILQKVNETVSGLVWPMIWFVRNNLIRNARKLATLIVIVFSSLVVMCNKYTSRRKLKACASCLCLFSMRTL